MTVAEKRGSATQRNAASRFELPLLGSNQDSPDPESGVLPVTPRGNEPLHVPRHTLHENTPPRPRATWDLQPGTCQDVPDGAEGARTPDLLGAIQALSQLSYSPEGELKVNSPEGWFKRISNITIRQISRRQPMRVLTVCTLLSSAVLPLPLTAQEPWTANVDRKSVV